MALWLAGRRGDVMVHFLCVSRSASPVLPSFPLFPIFSPTGRRSIPSNGALTDSAAGSAKPRPAAAFLCASAPACLHGPPVPMRPAAPLCAFPRPRPAREDRETKKDGKRKKAARIATPRAQGRGHAPRPRGGADVKDPRKRKIHKQKAVLKK